MIAIDTPSFISYPGMGTIGPFTIPFPVFEVENVEARIISDLGVITDLVITTDYTLSTIKPNTPTALTLVNVLPLLYTLEIRFSKRANQPAKLRDLGRFAAEIFEKALDRLTMNILALVQTVEDVESTIVVIEADIVALEAADVTLDARVTALELEDVSLDSRLDAIEMQDTVQDLAINDHESRIDALEAIAGTVNNVFYLAPNAGEITSKSMVLSVTPAEPTKALAHIDGGGDLIYGVDFTISGNVLSWNGLYLDGIISVGDIITIQYFS